METQIQISESYIEKYERGEAQRRNIDVAFRMVHKI